MNLIGAKLTMTTRDRDYWRAAYKRQLAVTNQLRTELAETHQRAEALENLEQENAGCHIAISYLHDQLAEVDRYTEEVNDLLAARCEHCTMTAITDANNLLRSKVAELARKLCIKDRVMECRSRTSDRLHDELIAVRKDNRALREALDSWA